MWKTGQSDKDYFFQCVGQQYLVVCIVENVSGKCGQPWYCNDERGLSRNCQPFIHNIAHVVFLSFDDLVEHMQFVIELGVCLARVGDLAYCMEHSCVVASTERVTYFGKGK